MKTDTPHVDWRENVAVVSLKDIAQQGGSTRALRLALRAVLSDLNAREERCHAIIVTAATDGFNFGEDATENLDGEDSTSASETLALEVFELLVAGRRPVIAAVEGSAAGAGLSIAAACDYVVSSTASRFSSNSAAEGLLPQGGLYWSLARRVRAGRARRMLLTGEVIGAQEAHSSGLVNLVVAPGELLERAIEVATRYARMPREALAWLKVAMATGSDTLEQAIETETNIQPLLRISEDHQEAVRAFLQKRSPSFIGR